MHGRSLQLVFNVPGPKEQGKGGSVEASVSQLKHRITGPTGRQEKKKGGKGN
jgi:hypothetical protein